MSDVGTGIFAKGRVEPEDVVALSAFPFACFGWFVLQGVVVSTFIECFLVRRCDKTRQDKTTTSNTLFPGAFSHRTRHTTAQAKDVTSASKKNS